MSVNALVLLWGLVWALYLGSGLSRLRPVDYLSRSDVFHSVQNRSKLDGLIKAPEPLRVDVRVHRKGDRHRDDRGALYCPSLLRPIISLHEKPSKPGQVTALGVIRLGTTPRREPSSKTRRNTSGKT